MRFFSTLCVFCSILNILQMHKNPQCSNNSINWPRVNTRSFINYSSFHSQRSSVQKYLKNPCTLHFTCETDGTQYFHVPSTYYQLLHAGKTLSIQKKKEKDEGILVPRIFMSRIFRSTYYGEFGGRLTEMICSQPFLVFSPLQLTSTGIPPDGSARNSCSFPFQPPPLSPSLSTAVALEKIETISSGKKRSIRPAWTPGRMFPGMIRDRRN